MSVESFMGFKNIFHKFYGFHASFAQDLRVLRKIYMFYVRLTICTENLQVLPSFIVLLKFHRDLFYGHGWSLGFRLIWLRKTARFCFILTKRNCWFYYKCRTETDPRRKCRKKKFNGSAKKWESKHTLQHCSSLTFFHTKDKFKV